MNRTTCISTFCFDSEKNIIQTQHVHPIVEVPWQRLVYWDPAVAPPTPFRLSARTAARGHLRCKVGTGHYVASYMQVWPHVVVDVFGRIPWVVEVVFGGDVVTKKPLTRRVARSDWTGGLCEALKSAGPHLTHGRVRSPSAVLFQKIAFKKRTTLCKIK